MQLTRALACSLLLFATALPASVLAQLDTSEDRLIPYQGLLEESGVAQTGTFDFRFALFATSDGDASCLAVASPASCGIWWDQVDGVPVRAGTFGATLGEGTHPLTDAVFAQPDLYLAIAVKASSDGAFTLLAGKQRLVAVPFANRAVAAKNYTVSGNLAVNGNATLPTGTLTLTSGVLQFGTTQRQMINMWGVSYGLGIQTSTLYARSADNFAWHRGGTHSNTALAPGAGGTLLMSLTPTGLTVPGEVNGGSLKTSGALSAGSASVTNAVSAGSVSSTGAVSGASVSATGAVSGASLSVSGELSADNNTRGTCAWTATFSEENPAMTCPNGRYVAGANCFGDYCDGLQLYCCEL